MATPWNDKLIILVAPTGETPSRDGGPNVPTNPDQIAEEVFGCYKAGASIVHVHARDRETNLPTSDIGVFKDIFRKIRERCDILIQATGAMGALYDPIKNTWAPPSDEERMALLNTDPKPDLTCVPTGSSNYSGPAGKSATLITTADFLRKFIRAATTKRIKWEMEIWDVSYLHNAFRLAEEGVFDKDMPLWLNYCLGDGIGSQPATPRQLIYVSEEGNRLFPRAIWELIARGQNHFRLLALGMILGCHIVRVGFEDHIYLPNGKIARNNIELVQCAVKIAKSLGRDIATVTEAKQIMSLPS